MIAGAAPDEHGERASANARATTLHPQDPDKRGDARRNRRPPKIRAPASAEHTHTHTCTTIAQQPTHDGKKRRPNERRARRARERERPPLPTATPRYSSRRDRRSHGSHATASDARAPNRTSWQPGASGSAAVASVTRESATRRARAPPRHTTKIDTPPADETSKVSDERRAFVRSR